VPLYQYIMKYMTFRYIRYLDSFFKYETENWTVKIWFLCI